MTAGWPSPHTRTSGSPLAVHLVGEADTVDGRVGHAARYRPDRCRSRSSRYPMSVAPARSIRSSQRRVRAQRRVVLDPARPVRMRRAQLVGVDRGVEVHLGDARAQVVRACARSRGGDPTCVYTKWSVNTMPSSAASRRNGKPTARLGARAGHAQRQLEVDRELEVHVEELGPQLQRAHVAVEVADVEAPEDRPLDLRPALLAHLFEVGVVPDVLERPREAAVAVEQARRVGDRAPAVRLPLGVEREVHADVLAAVLRRRVAGPRARDHERRARRDAVAQRRRRPRRWPTVTSRGRRS